MDWKQLADWKQLFKRSKAEVFGLDIGSSTVKIVQLHKDKAGYTVTAASIADIAGEKEGNNKEANTIKAIQECLESVAVQSQLAVCSICGPEVAVRYFKFPSLAAEEVQGAVLLEAEQVCPFNINDGIVDYQLIPNGKETRGVLIAATNKEIKRKSQFAKEAALDCVLMDVDGLALLNCYHESQHHKLQPKRTVAILNVGSSFANLVITGKNTSPLVRDVAYAGGDMAALSTKKDDRGKKSNFKLPEKACEKLITDVTNTLRYYMAQQESVIVEKIYVCGSFALVEGFVELLSNQLPAEVVLWNPFEKMRCEAGQSCRDILDKKGPAMAVAAGLAMRQI